MKRAWEFLKGLFVREQCEEIKKIGLYGNSYCQKRKGHLGYHITFTGERWF